MTHDELLETISSPNYMESRTLQTPYIALRAVVAIHQPIRESWESDDRCKECEVDGELLIYPCPTIKAIEKELA